MIFFKESEFKEDTEIGKVPKDWEVVKLNDVCELIRGTEPGSKSYNTEGIGIRFIRVSDISKQVLEEVFVNKNNNLVICKKDDILLALDGVPGVVAKGFEGAISSGIRIVKPKTDKIDKEFLFYILQHKIVQKVIENYTTGTTIKHASRAADFIILPLPPLEEQKAIAQILSTFDKAIQKTDEIIAKTERLKKGLMKELLTGRIRVEEKDGKIVFRKETEFKEDTEIGKIPKDWEVVKLGNEKITEDIFYGITAKAVDKNTGLRILRTTDIKNYSVDWDSLPFCEITEKRSDIGKYLLKNGDLIVARSGTVGVSVLVEKDFDNIVFGSYLIKIKLKPDVSPKFIHYFFQSSAYWNQIKKAQGSTLKNLNIPLLSSLQIFIPPTIEQQKIVEILSTIDKKLELERKRKEKLERIKKGLMDLLLTGKIRITQLYNKNQQQIQETSFKYFNDK